MIGPGLRRRRRRRWPSPRCCAAAPPAATRTTSSPTCRPRPTSSTASARASACRSSISRRPGRSTADEYFDRAGEVHDQWRNDPLVATASRRMRRTPCRDANFERIRMLADQLDVPVHCHVHETAQEVERVAREARPAPAGAPGSPGPGQRPPDRGAHDPAHRRRDRAVRRARRVSVVHCPRIQPQARLGLLPGRRSCAGPASTSPSAPTAAPATTTSTCSARCAPPRCWPRRVADDASALDAASALHAATLGGATALGFEDADRFDRSRQAGRPGLRRPGRARNPAAAPRRLAAGLRRGPAPGQRRLDRRPAQAARARAGRHGRATHSSPTRASGATASPRCAGVIRCTRLR